MTFEALPISPEVWDLANSIVGIHVLPREIAVALLHDVARALQIEVNRAELALVERRQAVETVDKRTSQLDAIADQLKALARTSFDVPWVACPRCGRRAPTTAELDHDPRCALSLRPPPRLSLVSPKRDEEEDDIA